MSDQKDKSPLDGNKQFKMANGQHHKTVQQ